MEEFEALIHDEDLRAQLVEARAKGFMWQTMARMLVTTQEKRDQERAKAAARAAQLAAMPREQRRRAVIREVIETQGPSPESLLYMPTPLAVCGLPYKALPPEQREFERTQGRMSVSVSAGKLRAPNGKWVNQPVPYGPKARLIMAYLTTLAKRYNSPTIETAETLSGFMRDLGFEPRGGAHGNISQFKEQLRALAACHMTMSTWDGRRAGQVNVQPFKKMELWFADSPDQLSLWPSKITFSTDFFEEVRDHSMPVDGRVLNALSNSARRLDLVMWLGYRLTRLNRPYMLAWNPLQSQFGPDYKRERKFREDFRGDVAAVTELLPKLRLRLSEQGLLLEPTDPAAFAIPKLVRKR
jgi:hypothetical protein